LSRAAAVRVAAAIVALVAAVGLSLQAIDVHSRAGDVGATLWILARYFTVTTNLLVFIVFAGLVFRRPWMPSPRVVAGTALSILLVGIVYAFVLRGIDTFFGVWRLDDLLVHLITPILGPLFWLTLTPKGCLRWRDPLLWGLYPLAYLVYALVRGAAEARYAYPFIDVASLGATRVGINSIAIAVGFIGVGLVWVAVDRAWGRQDAAARN
jgi:hypothetical protein